MATTTLKKNVTTSEVNDIVQQSAAKANIVDGSTSNVIQAIKANINSIPDKDCVCGKIDVDSYGGFYAGRKIDNNNCVFFVCIIGNTNPSVVTRQNGVWK